MERYIRRQNIEHYKDLLRTTTDPAQRRMLQDLLDEEERKLRNADGPKRKT